jgi:hypothetical protein
MLLTILSADALCSTLNSSVGENNTCTYREWCLSNTNVFISVMSPNVTLLVQNSYVSEGLIDHICPTQFLIQQCFAESILWNISGDIKKEMAIIKCMSYLVNTTFSLLCYPHCLSVPSLKYISRELDSYFLYTWILTCIVFKWIPWVIKNMRTRGKEKHGGKGRGEYVTLEECLIVGGEDMSVSPYQLKHVIRTR